jgi:S1-C subfamily serine protease
MPKDKHCDDSSGPSDSTSSEVCEKVVCEKKCDKESCSFDECPCERPEKLWCKKNNAVVSIHSEFILLGSSAPSPGQGQPPSPPTGTTPLAPNARADIILNGNGFFIKGHYIVAPASLVLIPPTLTSVANRWPFPQGGANVPVGANGLFQNKIVRASRILVTVFNVNGKGHSFVYEADLIGVDGAGDIAVLRIPEKKTWNQCNPCIEKCHPYLRLEDGTSHEGESVYLIGDYIANSRRPTQQNAAGAIVEGVLSDAHHLEYAGWLLAESVLVSAVVYARSTGLPILNCQGDVIGMQTSDLAGYQSQFIHGPNQTAAIPIPDLGVGYVAGPSTRFIKRVVSKIIKGSCSQRYNANLQNICDPVGAYYRFRKSYLGLAYDVFTGPDYDYTVDYTSGNLPFSQPRIRLDSQGRFLSSPSCKEIVGIRVRGIAGANPNAEDGIVNGYFYVPGGVATDAPYSGLSSANPGGIPASPLLGILQPGDVITHFGTVALGDLKKQIAPSLVTWRRGAGDVLTISYRRGGNALNNADNSITENYDQQYTQSVCLQDYPQFLDYPWYSNLLFPLIGEQLFAILQTYPNFVFPANQTVIANVPQRNPYPVENPQQAIFQPSI